MLITLTEDTLLMNLNVNILYRLEVFNEKSFEEVLRSYKN